MNHGSTSKDQTQQIWIDSPPLMEAEASMTHSFLVGHYQGIDMKKNHTSNIPHNINHMSTTFNNQDLTESLNMIWGRAQDSVATLQDPDHP